MVRASIVQSWTVFPCSWHDYSSAQSAREELLHTVQKAYCGPNGHVGEWGLQAVVGDLCPSKVLAWPDIWCPPPVCQRWWKQQWPIFFQTAGDTVMDLTCPTSSLKFMCLCISLISSNWFSRKDACWFFGLFLTSLSLFFFLHLVLFSFAIPPPHFPLLFL